MNGFVMALVLSAMCIIGMLLVLRMVWRDLKRAKDELVEAQTEILRKDSEMEVIRNVQEKVNAAMGKEKPKSKDAPASGDSASRIARLNGVQVDRSS